MNHHETITEMDGKTFYYSFLSGSKKLMEHQSDINKINIFPVPDADTGTNMASTMRFIIDNTQAHDSFKVTVDSIAEAALDGARGNSGVIFAQFFYGLSQSIGHDAKIVMSNFAAALRKAVDYTYEAISKPAEGTILTVIKRWVNYISENVHKTLDYVKMFRDSYAVAHHTMENERMDAMRKANVVDAGAKGFVLFLEGMKEFLHKRDTQALEHLNQDIVLLEQKEETPLEMGEFRYCTEAQLQGEALDKNKIRARIEKWGDSLVVAGSEKKVRIHIHTDNPAEFFQDLYGYGDIVFQKADDMRRQFESAHHRKAKIALVTDSACDLPQQLLDHYQVHMLPINIHFGKNHFLDKITITPNHFYDLVEESPVYPSTSQTNESLFLSAYSFLSSHYDSVISLHMSGNLSGTYHNSAKAAERIIGEHGKTISAIDSKTLSGSLGLIVLRAAQAIEAGMSHEELTRLIPEWIAKSELYVAVKTLKYMVRGGRVSAMKGAIANLLHIKPIITIDKDGKTENVSKAFSQKGLLRKIDKMVREYVKTHKIWTYSIVHAHNMPEALNYAADMERIIGKPPAYIQDISPVIGVHAGWGTVAVSLMAE
ncbi:MAG: hypothetical protein A2Y33_13300 [Spirochaetes bacterium GWF1_51_8]|nr:MAG: hypothetical protein A2Y33_13300 [Spirochaetes bacterium GWF1_51_8]